MKIGLYFGSFNPIHVGHLIIANHIVEHSDLDKIWMVVTPHNPHKKKSSLLGNYQRLQMVELAIESYDKIEASDIEFNLPQPNYTINTLAHLEEKYPKHAFCLIMGEDNLSSFHKWKNYDQILDRYSIYVYPRITQSKIKKVNEIVEKSNNIHKVEAPIVEISSTYIRKGIRNKMNIKPLLNDEVWRYIDHNLFYKK